MSDANITPDDQFAELFGDLANKLTLLDLLDLARQTWGDDFRQELPDIVQRLMVGVGDLARLARDGRPVGTYESQEWDSEIKKELGNLIFSTIRWCSDLGFTPGECVRAAAVAQAKFAQSGRPR